MNRKFNPLALIVALLVLVVFSTLAHAQETLQFLTEEKSKTVGTSNPLPTSLAPTYGYLTVATPTFTVPQNTAVSIGTLPAKTRAIDIYVGSGAANIGGADVASGTDSDYIASGSTKTLYVATTTPVIYLIGRLGSATANVKAR